jgi:cobalt-zinc-cadmium resistance protein CzcA
VLKSLIAFCLGHRAIVIFILILFAGAGLVAFRNLDIEAYPNPSPVILEISAQAPGLSASEMERYYAVPIENGLYAVPGIDVIRSNSFYGLSFVRVVFKYGVDYDFAFAQTAIALQQNVSLPGGVTANIQQNSGTGEILRYQLVGPKHFGLTNLRTVQDWIVRRRLRQVHGIVAINSWGGPTKQFEVEADPRKLQIYNITVPQIITALSNANINVGGREIRVGQQSINIRGIGLIDDGGNDDLGQGYKVNDIQDAVIAQSGSLPIRIKDVARVSVGFVPRLGVAGKDGDDDIVFGIVVMGRTYQTSNVLPALNAEVSRMNSDGSLPPGVKIVPFYNRGALVSVTTRTVMHNLVFGCILIFLIQWIFLGDLRSAVIVSLTIPFALSFAVIILVARGESANLLSLGAVDFGIIVDSAVILIENIFRNLQKNPAEKRSLIDQLRLPAGAAGSVDAATQQPLSSKWTDQLKMILLSVVEVDRAVFFSILIIVAAFVPLFTMEGVEGAIFGPMARTYAYALTGALIATFTVAPVLASLLFPEHANEKETAIVRFLHRIYSRVLDVVLSHRRATIACSLVFLVITGFVASRLGSEFLPHLDEGNLWIRAELPLTSSLEDGGAATAKMREILKRHPEVITAVSQHGRPDDGSDASPLSNVELFVPLMPYDQWERGLTKAQLVDDLNKEFADELPGVNFNFSQYIQDNIEEAISGVKGENSVKIVGPNLDELTKLANQIQNQMRNIPGVADLGIFPVLGQPNLNIEVDRAAASRYGLNTGDVTSTIQAALGGASATTVLESDRQFDLAVRYPASFRDSVSKIGDLTVAAQNPAGGSVYVPLRALASIKIQTGPSLIYHEAGERFIPVKFSVRGRDLGSVVGEAQQRIAQNVPLPSGYHLVWSGEFGELQAAKQRMEVIVPISLVLIFGLLYTLFNSLGKSLLTLVGIPFTMAGGVLALYVTGTNFSISAAIGFISLFGVSVMIGILLITNYTENLARGEEPRLAMVDAASKLMRPLLMMGLSAGIGLLPAAISTGIGSEVQRPLATVVVGGMLVGSVMLLLIVPTLILSLLGQDRKRGSDTVSK